MAEASHISAANALERGDRTAMFQRRGTRKRRAAENDESQRGRKMTLTPLGSMNFEPDIGRKQ